MPPRKRAASAPKAESEQEPLAPENEADDQQDAADDSASSAEEPQEQAPDGGEKPAEDDAPERSDLQTVDKPCKECFPNGWPEGAFSVGCTHGTWTRDNT